MTHDMKAIGGVDYRQRIPDWRKVPNTMPFASGTTEVCGMLSTEVSRFMLDMLELGRARTQKKELYAEYMDETPVRDMYLLLRVMSSRRFANPEANLGLDGSLVREAVAEEFFGGDYPTVEEGADEHGGLSDFLLHKRQEDDKRYGTLDPTLQDLFIAMEELSEMGSESDIVEKIRENIRDMAAPWVFTYMLQFDFAFYIGEYMQVDAIAMAFDHISEAEVNAAHEVTDDGPIVYLDAMQDDLRTKLHPHAMCGVMKAEGDYEAAEVPELQESGDWVGQTKYDGTRVFVHHSGDGDYRVNLGGGKKDVTAAMPELFEAPLSEQLPEWSFIFDAEATPYDAETGEVLPFQHILRRISRGDGLDADETGDLEVRFKFFDCLYAHETDIRDRKFEDRMEIVRSTFSPDLVARQGNNLEQVFLSSLDDGHEGIIMKRRGHEYQLGNRSDDWQKWKAEPETLDVVVTGANRGGGRLSDRVGALDIALEGPYGDLIDVGSVGTGFDDSERLDLWKDWEAGVLENSVIQVNAEELQVGRDRSKVQSSWALRFPSYDHRRPDGEVDTLERAVALFDMEEQYDEWAEEVYGVTT